MRKLLDYLLLPISLWLATYIRFRFVAFDVREFYLLATAVLSWFIITTTLQYYTDTKKRRSPSYRIIVISLFFFGMTGFSFYAQKELNFSRVALVLFTTVQYIIPLLVYGLLKVLKLIPHKEYMTLLLGSGELYQQLTHEYSANKKHFLTQEDMGLTQEFLVNTLIELQKKEELQEVIVASSKVDTQQNDMIIDTCHELGLRCQIIVLNQHISTRPLSAEGIQDYTYFRPLVNRLESRDNRTMKRLFDITVTLIILILISPILITLALLLKLSDITTPVLFRQKRTGYNQKEFLCYKFRSMNVVSQEIADATQATQDDPRITKLGAFMRKTNLDELPQLFNVLKGDMSLVGPRPHPIIMNELKEQAPAYLLRHFVTPGITGWAQVNGWRGETDTEEKIQQRVEHDLWYVENWSIWLDIKIMFMTLFSKKSYKNAG